MANKSAYRKGDYVVYPTHGVGKVLGVEDQEIAGQKLELIIIEFDKDRMTLRVPVAKADQSGLRKLSSPDQMKTALKTLKGKSRVRRTMWSRRAQEYEAKINSGDPVSIAEVVRDLFRNANQPDQSYSERQLYQAALDRLARGHGQGRPAQVARQDLGPEIIACHQGQGLIGHIAQPRLGNPGRRRVDRPQLRGEVMAGGRVIDDLVLGMHDLQKRLADQLASGILELSQLHLVDVADPQLLVDDVDHIERALEQVAVRLVRHSQVRLGAPDECQSRSQNVRPCT